jgi:hypothetical protein
VAMPKMPNAVSRGRFAPLTPHTVTCPAEPHAGCAVGTVLKHGVSMPGENALTKIVRTGGTRCKPLGGVISRRFDI